MKYAVKMGGSAIAPKDRAYIAREDVIARLAQELARSGEQCLVVHGGGSFGHAAATEHGMTGGALDVPKAREAFSHIHRAMERLNAAVMDGLLKAGIPAVAVPPAAVCTLEDGRIVNLNEEPVRFLVDGGMTPVLFGDVVQDRERGFAIVSGDQLLAYLAPRLGIGRAVLCSDVDGVYTSDPRTDPGARRIDVLTPEALARVDAGGSAASDVTGGMRGKLDELLPLARAGVESLVIDANAPGALERALGGATDEGTFIPVII